MCREYSLLISAQFDGHASADEQARLQQHLGECSACRRYAAELRCLRNDLRRLELTPPPSEMSSDIVAALQYEARLQAKLARQRADRLDMWRMRIFSQSVGTVVSVTLFFFLMLEIVRPIQRAFAIQRAFEIAKVAAGEAGYLDNYDEARKLADLLLPPLPNNPRPVFIPQSVLLGLSNSFSEGDVLVVTVDVWQDGRGLVKKVIDPPQDPSLIPRLSNALYVKASFHPAARRGRFIRSDAVLMLSKVNVTG